MIQIDRNTAIEFLTGRIYGDLSTVGMFEGKLINDMTDEELAKVIYFVMKDYWVWRKLATSTLF